MFDLRDSSRPIGAAQLQAAEAPGTMKAANAAAFHPSGPQPTCLSTPLTTPASVGPSAAAYVLLDTCLRNPRTPGPTQTLIENDPLPPWSTKNVTRSTRTTDAGTSGYAPALPQCFRQPV